MTQLHHLCASNSKRNPSTKKDHPDIATDERVSFSELLLNAFLLVSSFLTHLVPENQNQNSDISFPINNLQPTKQIMPNFIKAALFLAISALSTANEWEVLDDVKLPKALSDNTATSLPSGEILIAGGCDAPNGNTFIDAEGNQLDFFICESISDELYSFNPTDGTFTTLTKLPR